MQSANATWKYRELRRAVRALFRGRRRLFWLMALLMLVGDQVTKVLFASTAVERVEGLTLIPGILRFVDKLPNTQGVFGMGPTSPFFYAVATLAGLGLIAYSLRLATAP